jgi:hypothetical protein
MPKSFPIAIFAVLTYSICRSWAQFTVDQEIWPTNQLLPKCTAEGNEPSKASRVCTERENDDPEAFNCDTNYLKRKTVYLTSSPWKSSLYATWIAQIIIAEQLHYPVRISHNIGGDHNFYGKNAKSILNSKEYAWEGLANAYEDMSCSDEYRESLPFLPGTQNSPECAKCVENSDVCLKGSIPPSCKPCTHAMLDVWETQDANIEKYVQQDGIAEIAGPLGYSGGMGWFYPTSGLEKRDFSSFAHLRNETIAGEFGQLLTWGQYCFKVWKGEIAHDPPDILNSNGRRRRCAQADIDSSNACLIGSWVVGAPSDDSFCELFYMYGKPASVAAGLPMSEVTCKEAKPGGPTDPVHVLCSKYVITVQDIFNLLSPLAAELSSSRFSGINPLYSGYFDPQFDNSGAQLATLAVGGCNWNDPERPSGATWTHDYMEMVLQDGMRLKAVDYGAFVYDVHDVAARKAIDEKVYQPQLLFLGRPNPQMQRYKYDSNVRKPYTYNKREPELVRGGDAFRLEELNLAPGTEECERRRNTLYQGHCPDANANLQTIIATRAKQNLYQCGKNETLAVCTPAYDHCGYKKHKPFKVLSSKLERYLPEVHYFLRKMELTLDDIEEIMASAGYDTKYTAAENQEYAERWAVCAWVTKNEARWRTWLPSSANVGVQRCLGEVNDTFSGGKYIPGVMCSGHGECKTDSGRRAANFYAGKCECSPGYIGDDCSQLGEGENIDLNVENTLVLGTLIVNGLAFIVVVLVWIFLFSNKHEPVIFYCSYAFLKWLTMASTLSFAHLYFWLGNVTAITCMVRPLAALYPYLIFVGTIFGRVYRTTTILWGKTPPPKIVTDGEYVENIMKKVLVPEIVLCVIWFLVEQPTIGVGRPVGRPWEQYTFCAYGSTGNTFAAITIAYCAGVTVWAGLLLYAIHKSGDNPMYHNHIALMSKALVVVGGTCSVGVFLCFVFQVPTAEIPSAITLKWLTIAVVTPFSAVMGLYTIILPTYKSIYMNPDENIIFPGRLYQQQVIENNKIRQVFPTEDEASIDPRVLRKNKELLKENLQLIDAMRDSRQELASLDEMLQSYETKRKERAAAIVALQGVDVEEKSSKDDEHGDNAQREEGDEDSDEGEDMEDSNDGEEIFKIKNYNLASRVAFEIDAAVNEASEYLGGKDSAQQSEKAQIKIVEEKREKINKILDRYSVEKKKRKVLELASHNSLPPLDNILRYHNLLQYTRMFQKLKMTTSKLIQMQDEDISRLPMRLGHRRKLQVAIKNLVGEKPPPLPTPTATPAPSIAEEILRVDEMSALAILSKFELDQFSEALLEFGCEASTDLLILADEDLDSLGMDEEHKDTFKDLKDWLEEEMRKQDFESERNMQLDDAVPEVDEDSVNMDLSDNEDESAGVNEDDGTVLQELDDGDQTLEESKVEDQGEEAAVEIVTEK